MKTDTQILSYEGVVERVKELAQAGRGPSDIADTILLESEIDLDAQATLLRMGIQALAVRRYKITRDDLNGEEEISEQEPFIETVYETDSETGKTVEKQKRRIPNITKNHRKMAFRGLYKPYRNAAGQEVPLLQFTLEDVAPQLAVARGQSEAWNFRLAAWEATDAALRKYSAKDVSELSDKVKERLDALWLEVRE